MTNAAGSHLYNSPIFALVFFALAVAPRPVNTSPALTPYERMEQEQK